METKEAILSTISEFSKKDFNSEDSTQDLSKNKDSTNIFIDIKEESEIDLKYIEFDNEIAMLLKLKEKSLVLFEGLKQSKDSNIQMKLEMVISYLEYQLYIIEDRLKTLQENQAKNELVNKGEL
ncbi:hypothetical protein CCY99_09210 [Helicobacter sp. 16-1353]|uniref:CiaD-like domain-containing protein n=1 Tax=Helicobacter sp. 16-1353 TaxID=2004996 RepID=UPI000DCD227F|nr:hypothetical protein [Helicobacter sp. 16-1353]RAX51381.1 hypothetical protein CCY99_09210 [Helicobacter sp. 16-1353]